MISDRTDLLAVLSDGEFPKDFPINPFAREMSASLAAANVKDGSIAFTFQLGKQFLQGAGAVQGGIVSSLLDFTIAMAIISQMAEGESISTTDLNVQFLRPSMPGPVRCAAQVVKLGRRVAFGSGELCDMDGRALATASATNLVLRKE